MKKIFKKISYVLLAAIVLIQFYPRPEKNLNKETGTADISKVFEVPAPVLQVLQTSCYDCHSNNTAYPWYSQIQPVALWLNDHVEEGKAELNFSEFGNYSIRRQYRKLEEINEEVKEGEMPLSSYTLIHRNAKLENEQKLLLANWTTSIRDDFKAKYPPDSLERKKQAK